MAKSKTIPIVDITNLLPKCGNCIHMKTFYEKDDVYTECYRYPPKVVASEEFQFIVVTVSVEPDRDACGEFKSAN